MKKLILFLCLVSFQAQAQEVYNFYFQKKADDATVNGAPLQAGAPQVVVMTPAKPELAKHTDKYFNLGMSNWTIGGTDSSETFSGVTGTFGYRTSSRWALEGQGTFGRSRGGDWLSQESFYSLGAAYDALTVPVYGKTIFDLYVVGHGGVLNISNYGWATVLNASLRAEFTFTDSFGAFFEYRRNLGLTEMLGLSRTSSIMIPDDMTTLSIALNF